MQRLIVHDQIRLLLERHSAEVKADPLGWHDDICKVGAAMDADFNSRWAIIRSSPRRSLIARELFEI